MKKFIDDISVLAIESCIIKKVLTLVNPEKMFDMNDEKVNHLVSEDKSTAFERVRCAEKRDNLVAGLQELRRLDMRRLAASEDESSICYKPLLPCTNAPL